MRSLLKDKVNQRVTVTARFERYGIYRYRDPIPGRERRTTLLLKDVYLKDEDGDVVIADHLWLPLTDNWRKVDLRPFAGDVVQFDATVAPYTKFPEYGQTVDDYKLCRPYRINLVDTGGAQ